MTKIAIITDDGRYVSRHYGMARAFAVVTIDGGREVSQELRRKANHSVFIEAEIAARDREGRVSRPSPTSFL
jgi:predicted Fe-Mo cluster-binding NifX family protein